MSMVSPEFLGCSHPVRPRGIFRSNVPYDFHAIPAGPPGAPWEAPPRWAAGLWILAHVR
jgi:hypothetical protein